MRCFFWLCFVAAWVFLRFILNKKKRVENVLRDELGKEKKRLYNSMLFFYLRKSYPAGQRLRHSFSIYPSLARAKTQTLISINLSLARPGKDLGTHFPSTQVLPGRAKTQGTHFSTQVLPGRAKTQGTHFSTIQVLPGRAKTKGTHFPSTQVLPGRAKTQGTHFLSTQVLPGRAKTLLFIVNILNFYL